MELYERIVRDLPPTPSKFHYIFNLRDLSRIYHGLTLTIPDRFDSPSNFVRVWRNECLRVFYDRLTNDKDRTLVSEHISELLQQHLGSHTEVNQMCMYTFQPATLVPTAMPLCQIVRLHYSKISKLLLIST